MANKIEELEKILIELDDKYTVSVPQTRKNIDAAIEKIVKLFAIPNVVKSLPNDEKVKVYIDTLPYYGTCTTEYNEGFEDGVKWLKEQIAK